MVGLFWHPAYIGVPGADGVSGVFSGIFPLPDFEFAVGGVTEDFPFTEFIHVIGVKFGFSGVIGEVMGVFEYLFPSHFVLPTFISFGFGNLFRFWSSGFHAFEEDAIFIFIFRAFASLERLSCAAATAAILTHVVECCG